MLLYNSYTLYHIKIRSSYWPLIHDYKEFPFLQYSKEFSCKTYIPNLTALSKSHHDFLDRCLQHSISSWSCPSVLIAAWEFPKPYFFSLNAPVVSFGQGISNPTKNLLPVLSAYLVMQLWAILCNAP